MKEKNWGGDGTAESRTSMSSYHGAGRTNVVGNRGSRKGNGREETRNIQGERQPRGGRRIKTMVRTYLDDFCCKMDL